MNMLRRICLTFLMVAALGVIGCPPEPPPKGVETAAELGAGGRPIQFRMIVQSIFGS